MPLNSLQWRQIGPAFTGGRVTAVVGSLRNPLLYYVGTADGGVIKSIDGGGTWKSIFTHNGVSSIGAMAIDPENDAVLWVGTGEANPRNDVTYGNGVWRSSDGGSSWSFSGLRETRYISSIVVDPKHPSTVFVGAVGDVFKNSSSRGLYRTSDNGTHWARTLYVDDASGISDIAVDPKNPNTVYAAVWTYRRYPWIASDGGPADAIYKSIDNGKTWRRLHGHGLPSGVVGRIGLAIAPSRPSTIYAVIGSKLGVLWRSDDSGSTWRLVSRDRMIDNRPFYYSHAVVDPTNSRHVFFIAGSLTESTDGGGHIRRIALPHSDFHALWIDPNNPKRIIAGNDGGWDVTADGGHHWVFSQNAVIGQVYHVGLGQDNPYTVCAALQDNSAFCGPSNSLDDNGISNRYWNVAIGGDGEWAIPSPKDATMIYADWENGNLGLTNLRTGYTVNLQPYVQTADEQFFLYKSKYRFNWDSPIAIDHFNPDRVWFGGNVVFETLDEGRHWQVISPDLTLDNKDHQRPSGGPVLYDNTGAEYSDTILDIEGSELSEGEIWVGTDDGLIQVTRDGGHSWKNVTVPRVPPYCRVETVAPSALEDGVAYANLDCHRSGDYKPYAFVTRNFGGTWTSVAGNLPKDQYVRTVRPDAKNKTLVYAGLEQGIWISYDQGVNWLPFNINVPPVSVRDIRIQETQNDLVIGTHGLGVWIFDDLAPIQGYEQARESGVALFAPRPAYEWYYGEQEEGLALRYEGKNPPNGAIVNYYLQGPSQAGPVVEIRTDAGALVRRFTQSRDAAIDDSARPPNRRGFNRFVWDFTEVPPVTWKRDRRPFSGPHYGATVPPGTYQVKLLVDGKVSAEDLRVEADPRLPWSQADYVAAYQFQKKYIAEYSIVNTILNALDVLLTQVARAQKTTSNTNRGALTIVRSAATALSSAIVPDAGAYPQAGALRDDVESLTSANAGQPPYESTIEFAGRVDKEYLDALHRFDELVAQVHRLNVGLSGDGQRPISEPATIPIAVPSAPPSPNP